MLNENNDLERAVAALKSDENLLGCFLEMIDTVDERSQQLKTGDDAEDAVVNVIQKTGATLLKKWMQKKEKQAQELASSDPSMRPHEKKHPLAYICWRRRIGCTRFSQKKMPQKAI